MIDGKSISRTMQKWMGGVLAEFSKRPASTGSPDAMAGSIRSYSLRVLIWKAEQLGFQPTRNLASEPKSACDVVKAALEIRGISISYDTIAKARNACIKFDPASEKWSKLISSD